MKSVQLPEEINRTFEEPDMESRLFDLTPVAVSVWVYRMLLKIYPVRFQREYGSHMVQVFRDCFLRTVRQGGTNGMLKLWAATLLDLVQSVISEHVHKEIEMKKEMKPEDVRKAGWMLILGTPAFILGTYWETSVWDLWILGFPLLLLSIPMLAYGSKGLQARYSETVGSFGANILRFGRIIGPITSLVGFIMAWFINWMFTLIYMGPAILLASLTVFGLAALLKRPFLNWKPLTVFAAVWYPAFYINFLIGRVTSGGWPTVTFNNSDLVIMAIPGIAMVVLGYILKSDVPEEIPAIA
jgi:hypothetical protein